MCAFTEELLIMKNLYLKYNVTKMFFKNLDKRYYYATLAIVLALITISNTVEMIQQDFF